MLFVPVTTLTPRPHPFRPPCTRRRPRRPQFSPTCLLHSTNGPHTRPPPADADYSSWSADFLELCRTQLDLLASSVPDALQVALFFRRENRTTGALEFVPLAVAGGPAGAERVWIGGATASDLELSGGTAHLLPGGLPAASLLPDYPALAAGAIELPDGALCVPVTYANTCAGSVVLWRKGAPAAWAAADVSRASAVARSIAIAAALDGRTAARERSIDRARELVRGARNSLREAAHQIRSPVAALVTFGHVLLRRLPPGDELRALAKNIVVEARRLDDLLAPVESASRVLLLVESRVDEKRDEGRVDERRADDRRADDRRADDGRADDGRADDGRADDGWVTLPTAEKEELVWMSDMLGPIASSASVQASEKGLHFHVVIDDDTPPVRFVERDVREAVYNVLDNAMRYTPKGGHVGLMSGFADDAIEVSVWDTGPGIDRDERDEIWRCGKRGNAAAVSGVPGDGIGLDVARRAVEAAGGVIEVRSPLAAEIDPRPDGSRVHAGTLFCIRFPRAGVRE